MLDHVSISVSDYDKSLKFYDSSLAILGYNRIITIDNEHAQCAGYGKENKPHFWISPMGDPNETLGGARGLHFAFLAPDANTIGQWYQHCLNSGATDNGAPGPRPYHPHYYGAFVIDPDGWRIEACYHEHS